MAHYVQYVHYICKCTYKYNIYIVILIVYSLLLLYRQEVIERLQSEHSVVILVTNSLTNYMDKVRQLVKENPEIDANTFMPDGRYNHIMQVQERLNFLRFLLKVCPESRGQNKHKFLSQKTWIT